MDDALDSGLFQHGSGPNQFHLLREVFLTHRQLMRRLSAETGLSGAQFEVMRELARADGCSSVSVLARDLGVDPAAIFRLVAGLSEVGFVSRERDPRDKRRQPVMLTDKGRDLMLAFHQKAHDGESTLTGALDPESVKSATRVLKALREALESAVPGKGR
jgi:DNA-binding MarR family transcriptional regulator